ncbi:hypothetical protein [Spiroplasma endosymbiont of Nebria brevicollis]|uniref:hypothetical protein n=1 Tax=Spiroplasma endosymbiont of Nebria brevicollis TaxID=3066284 RepID=UPI00313B9FBE
MQRLESDIEAFEQKKQNIIDQEWKTKPFFERIKAHLKLIKLCDNESHCDYNKMQSVDKITKINKKLKLQEKLLFEAPPNSHITELSSIMEIIIENELELFKQINAYKNINEYEENPSLIQENLPYKKIPIKDLVNEQIKLKSKPSKVELNLWITFVIITIAIIVIPFILPHIWLAAPTILFDKTAFALIGVSFKTITSVFSTVTKKVESWFYNNLLKNQDKKELKTIIKDLNSDKLEAQYNILKTELDIRKPWKINKLLNETDIQINKTTKLNCSHKYPAFNPEVANSLALKSESKQPSTRARSYSF